jgi:hypothetical protein
MMKSAFQRQTRNISINYAVDNSDPIFPQVINDPPLVLIKISRQAAKLFANDGSQLIIPPDWLEFFDVLPKAIHFMQESDRETAHNDIECAPHYCGADKAPGPSFLTVRHLRNLGVTDYLYKIFYAALRVELHPQNGTIRS